MTGTLSKPVRYCGNVMTSPGLRTSWKNRKSTSKKPTMSVTASAFFILHLSRAEQAARPQIRRYATRQRDREPLQGPVIRSSRDRNIEQPPPEPASQRVGDPSSPAPEPNRDIEGNNDERHPNGPRISGRRRHRDGRHPDDHRQHLRERVVSAAPCRIHPCPLRVRSTRA